MNLEQFCLGFQGFLEEKPTYPRLLKEGQLFLKELVGDPFWFREILKKIILDPEFINLQKDSVFENEITLYRSPDRAFSVLAYLWEAQSSTPIHDHGSWGIIGALTQRIQEKKYRRLDDGKKEGVGEIQEISSRWIEPGDTTYVLPLDEGIHRMEAAADRGSITISIYGESLRKGYIHFFDASRRKVIRAYPPKLYKKVLAIRSLGTIREPWAKELLAAGILHSVPDPLKEEYQQSLNMLKSPISE